MGEIQTWHDEWPAIELAWQRYYGNGVFAVDEEQLGRAAGVRAPPALRCRVRLLASAAIIIDEQTLT